MQLPHKWERYGDKSKIQKQYIKLIGKPDACVRTKKCPNGRYLWQHGKQAGYANTVEEAKEIVEAAREFYPRHIR